MAGYVDKSYVDATGRANIRGDKKPEIVSAGTADDKISLIVKKIDKNILKEITGYLVMAGSVAFVTLFVGMFVGAVIYKSLLFWLIIAGIAVVYGIRVIQGRSSFEPVVDVVKPLVYLAVIFLIFSYGIWNVYFPERDLSVRSVVEIVKEKNAAREYNKAVKKEKTVPRKIFSRTFTSADAINSKGHIQAIDCSETNLRKNDLVTILGNVPDEKRQIKVFANSSWKNISRGRLYELTVAKSYNDGELLIWLDDKVKVKVEVVRTTEEEPKYALIMAGRD